MATDFALPDGELSGDSEAWIGGDFVSRLLASNGCLGHLGDGHANVALGIAQVHAHGLSGGPAIAFADAIENALMRGDGILRRVSAIGVPALADVESFT